MYRPYRPHTEQNPVAPNEPLDYKVEVWPTAHVFRPGHRLVVIVTAPPAIDSNYSFAAQSNQPASLNTLIYDDPAHPSSITLPVLPAERDRGPRRNRPGLRRLLAGALHNPAPVARRFSVTPPP